jgi:hypothetical protein
MRHFPLREFDYAIGFVVLLAALYAGAYYATVRPMLVGSHDEVNGWNADVHAVYPFAQETSEAVFRPINLLDRGIRPEYWSIRANIRP